MSTKRTPRTPSARARTSEQRREFISVLRDTGNVRLSCQRAGIGRSTVYEWRDRFESFRAEWEDAENEACDVLEAEARRRALQGVEEPIYHQGEKVGTVRKYSDQLIMFLLKGQRPEKYHERLRHSGPGGGVIPIASVDLAKLSDDELANLERLVGKIAAEPGADPR